MVTRLAAFFRGRIARRLVALFVLGALIPVSLSDWISISAIEQVAKRFGDESRSQTTRQVSRQVLDRLLTCKTLLSASAQMTEAPAHKAPPAAVAGLGSAFLGASFRDSERPDESADASAELHRLWAEADPTARTSGAQRNPTTRIELRVAQDVQKHVRLLMANVRGDVPTVVAELDPSYVWAPVLNANDDAKWTVSDDRGRLLFSFRGADAKVAINEGEGTLAGPAYKSQLFLAVELSTPSWTFVQHAAPPTIYWHGQPLVLWLTGVALAAILTVGAFASWRVRRTLVPLERLTEGTKLLAAGNGGARVVAGTDDELGVLGTAFNEMADELQARFDSLRRLADIDADILSGQPFHLLTTNALENLLDLYPGAHAAVAWREGTSELVSISFEGSGAKSMEPNAPVRAQLNEVEIRRFESISDAEPGIAPSVQHAVTESAVLGFLPTCWTSSTPKVWLAIKESGRTRGLIALSLATPLSEPQLLPARDVRDRLAVALIARSREDELVYRAVHDSLTGLSNGYGLRQDLGRLLAGQSPSSFALLFIDLDHFKEVNDSHGHIVGDELLRAVAKRLTETIPEATSLARNGGDEFVVIIQLGDLDLVHTVAARTVDALAKPFSLSQTEHTCGASIGISVAPHHGRSADELMRCADIALYVAKANGRSTHVIFDPAFDTATRERATLLAGLRNAVAGGELVAHYQPRISVTEGRVTSAEALVRWNHPDRGLLMPGVFIELAESAGLIIEIGDWMLDAVCSQIAQWHREGLLVGRVSLNVSPRQLMSGELPQKVRAALQRHAIEARFLELEITESLLVGDATDARAQLFELKDIGVSIAMDDFGTGYSSMTQLRQLPIDVLKVDRSFVADLPDPGALAMVAAIVAMAKALSLHLVAEGVETQAQADRLRALKCDEFQGFLFGRAVSAEQFVQFVQHRVEIASA